MELIVKRCFLLFASLTLGFMTGLSQNAPVTTAGTVNNALPGSQITIPITVTGFNNIGSITLALDYDYSKMHYVSGTKNPLMAGTLNIGDNNLGNGMHRLMVGWYGPGTSLSNGTWILNLVFTYYSGAASLQWFDSGPSCEYTDDNTIVLNDVPTASYYLNGLICGSPESPVSITGSNSVCKGQTNIPYSIDPLTNVTGYNWAVPTGASIISGGNTNAILVNYSPAALSGNVSVNGINDCGTGPASSLPVTVNAMPIANAGNDTTIPYGTSAQIHASSGGTGSFTYHWSPENLLVNPDVQNPMTILLTTTTLFHLVVTNSSGLCQSSDDMIIGITGGPLSANPTVLPGELCRGESAQLFPNAGGGSGNYTYTWVCSPPGTPPWTSNLENPTVTPDSTTLYQLNVSDGYTSSGGSTELIVHQLPSAVISGGGSLCDDGSMAPIRIDLTGTPPWSFSYSNGMVVTSVDNQTTTPYFNFTAIPGNYTMISVQDISCFGNYSGEAQVIVTPVPITPTITQNGYQLISSASSGNQWYKNNVVIPGETGQTYTVSETGLYSVISTILGCSSDTSNVVDVVVSGVQNTHLRQILIYPNPAKTSFKIIFDSQLNRAVMIKILTVNGIVKKEIYMKSVDGSNEVLVNAKELPAGLYYLLINDSENVAIQKIILF